MQRVAVGNWGELAVYGWDEELPILLSARAPRLLERVAQCRPATLVTGRNRPIGPVRPPLPYVAVWPTDAAVPDTQPNAPAWKVTDIEGVLLTEYVPRLHCFVCDGDAPALYAEFGLPFFEDFRRHDFASGCPLCGAPFVTSRMGALLMFTRTTSSGEDTSPA